MTHSLRPLDQDGRESAAGQNDSIFLWRWTLANEFYNATKRIVSTLRNENAHITFQTSLGKKAVEYKRAQRVRCFVFNASSHDISLIFFLIHSFVRKEVEGNGVGNSDFQVFCRVHGRWNTKGPNFGANPIE